MMTFSGVKAYCPYGEVLKMAESFLMTLYKASVAFWGQSFMQRWGKDCATIFT